MKTLLNRFKRRIIWFKIDLPALLAFALFAVLIFFILIPGFEDVMMDRKRQLLKEITANAWSVLDHFHTLESNGSLDSAEARKLARSTILSLRYGEDNKDYFWITDRQPVMIGHPYRNDLDGKDLSSFKDSGGKLLFVESVNEVNLNGEGFIDYMWQRNDDSTLIVPKISYVRLYSEWDWIIGTGIYVEDVKTEIRRIERSAILISGIIGVIIIALLIAIARQSHRMEIKRREAEDDLVKSRELYRTLAEAATEGIIIWTSDNIKANPALLLWMGCSEAEFSSHLLREVFYSSDISENEGADQFFDRVGPGLTGECELIRPDGTRIKAITAYSGIHLGSRKGVLILVRTVKNTGQIQYLNPPISILESSSTGFFRIAIGRKSRFLYASSSALKIFGFSNLEELLSSNPESLFEFPGQLRYVKTKLNTGTEILNQIIVLKKPDDARLNVLISIAITEHRHPDLLCEGIVELTGASVETGMATENTSQYFPNEITKITEKIKSSDAGKLSAIYKETIDLSIGFLSLKSEPVAISAFLSETADRICHRIIEISISETGPPPCSFAFIQTGSAGRREQTMITDQDNGIVYSDNCPGPEAETHDYFVKLGKRINELLNNTGYRFCTGGNMAGNDEWCQPVSQWKKYFSGWISNPEPSNILAISIFFDFRHCYGDGTLTTELKSFVKEGLRTNDICFHLMASAWQGFESAISIKENESADLKKMQMPLTGLIRLYALKAGVTQLSSPARITELYTKGVFDIEFMRDLLRAHSGLLFLRLTKQSQGVASGHEPDNKIDTALLSVGSYFTLEHAVTSIRKLMQKASVDFRTREL